MKVYSMYFSPTGGTKKVMVILTEALEIAGEIDLSLPDQDYSTYRFEDGDVCLVGIPSFGGRVPETALVHIRAIHVGRAAAIPVIVYGNRAYDDTMLELKNELISCGFKVPAAVAAVAEHSIMHQFGAGRPDERDREELKTYALKIKSLLTQIDNGGMESLKTVDVPGKEPYCEYNGVPFKPTAGKSCKHCGICAAKCPVKAIPESHPESVDEKVCISCMRCVALCPVQARTLNKLVLAAASAKMKKACSTRKENELFI